MKLEWFITNKMFIQYLVKPFGEDFFCVHNKNLLFNLVRRNLLLKYRQSYLGILWSVLVPALSALIYYFVFQKILKVQIQNHFLFVLTGLISWQFFSVSISQAVESIVANHTLVNKVPVPPRIFPFTEVCTVFLNFVLSLPVVIIVMLFTKDSFHLVNLTSVVFFFLMFIQSYGFALIFGTLFVFLRDLKHVIGIVMQVWFYLTPVIYQKEMIPPEYKWMSLFNPVGYLFHGVHESLVFDRGISWEMFFICVIWTFGTLFVGFIIYNHFKKIIVENL